MRSLEEEAKEVVTAFLAKYPEQGRQEPEITADQASRKRYPKSPQAKAKQRERLKAKRRALHENAIRLKEEGIT